VQTLAVEVRDGVVAKLYSMRNPDKLRYVH